MSECWLVTLRNKAVWPEHLSCQPTTGAPQWGFRRCSRWGRMGTPQEEGTPPPFTSLCWRRADPEFMLHLVSTHTGASLLLFWKELRQKLSGKEKKKVRDSWMISRLLMFETKYQENMERWLPPPAPPKGKHATRGISTDGIGFRWRVSPLPGIFHD